MYVIDYLREYVGTLLAYLLDSSAVALSVMVSDSVGIVYCAGLVDVYSSHSMDARHHAARILDVSFIVWSHVMPCCTSVMFLLLYFVSSKILLTYWKLWSVSAINCKFLNKQFFSRTTCLLQLKLQD